MPYPHDQTAVGTSGQFISGCFANTLLTVYSYLRPELRNVNEDYVRQMNQASPYS